MVLLDGLDEVVAERGRVVALVDDFVREYLPEPKVSGGRAIASKFLCFENQLLINSAFFMMYI